MKIVENEIDLEGAIVLIVKKDLQKTINLENAKIKNGVFYLANESTAGGDDKSSITQCVFNHITEEDKFRILDILHSKSFKKKLTFLQKLKILFNSKY